MAQEKTYENKIKHFLKAKNIWYYKIWGGGLYTKAGVPDIIACVNGRFVAIEVKSETGKVTALQNKNIEDIIKSGGIAIITRPSEFEDLKKMIGDING